MNTTTTQLLDGTVVTEEISDDAEYYRAVAKMKTTVDCHGYTFEQCGLLTAIAGLVDVARGYPQRGMNDNELAAKVSGDVVSTVPYGVLGYGVYRMSKMETGATVTGEQVNINESFNPTEVHSTGSSQSPVSVPFRTTESTTYVPVQ